MTVLIVVACIMAWIVMGALVAFVVSLIDDAFLETMEDDDGGFAAFAILLWPVVVIIEACILIEKAFSSYGTFLSSINPARMARKFKEQ